jgi:hypothetical protein
LGHFLNFLWSVVVYAFHICETVIALTLIWVYGRFAVRHILTLGRKDNDV